ncbi:MAG: hypothetical protein NTW86_16535 [Candidatus Sumerlaeota bacterium]|nr:hypothetical protein [Candidatus Sumerlaeota bacterium]
MDLLAEFREIVDSMEREGIDYSLCGGLAMDVYAMRRGTLDVDLMIEADSLPRVKQVMEGLGFLLSGGTMEFQRGDVRIHRLSKVDAHSGEAMVLDLLLVTPKTRQAWESRRRIEWEAGVLNVVSPEGLIALKRLRNSGKDQDDIEYLRSVSDED